MGLSPGIDVVSWETSLARTSDAEVAHWSPMLFPCHGTWKRPADSIEFSSPTALDEWGELERHLGACTFRLTAPCTGISARSAEGAGVSPNKGSCGISRGSPMATECSRALGGRTTIERARRPGLRDRRPPERARAPNGDLVTLARQAPTARRAAQRDYRPAGGRWAGARRGGHRPRGPPMLTPSRGRDRGGDEWSCHDGTLRRRCSPVRPALRWSGNVASQQRETASSSRRVSRRLWPAERARAMAARGRRHRPSRRRAAGASRRGGGQGGVRRVGGAAGGAAAEAGDLAPLREWLDASTAPDLASAALLRACGVGDAGLARALLAVGAPVDGCGARGTTALMLASTPGHEAAVRALGRAAVDQGDEGDDAPMLASHKGHLGVARALLAAGARADLADAHGQRAPSASSAADAGSGTRRGAVARSSARSAAAGGSSPNGRPTASRFADGGGGGGDAAAERAARRGGEGGEAARVLPRARTPAKKAKCGLPAPPLSVPPPKRAHERGRDAWQTTPRWSGPRTSTCFGIHIRPR